MEIRKSVYKGVMLHHSATGKYETADYIRLLHLNKKYGDVGYNFILQHGKDGHLYLKTGRNTKYVGAHCDAKTYNSEYIGVCLIGNYENDSLTDTQYNELIRAICHIMKKYSAYGFLGHREAKATACPGKNINLNQIRKDLTAKLGREIKAVKL